MEFLLGNTAVLQNVFLIYYISAQGLFEAQDVIQIF